MSAAMINEFPAAVDKKCIHALPEHLIGPTQQRRGYR